MYSNGNTGYTTNGLNGMPSTLPTSHVVFVTHPMHVMPSSATIPRMTGYPMQSVPSMLPPPLNYSTYPTQQQQQNPPIQPPISYLLLPPHGTQPAPRAGNQFNQMGPQYVVNMNVRNNVYHPPPPPLPSQVSSPSVPDSGLSSLYITRSAFALSVRLCM